jgi:hypothetical protein
VDANNVLFKSSIGFSGITNPTPGHYVLTFSGVPPAVNNRVATATLNVAVGGEITYLYGVGTIEIFTFDSTGAHVVKTDFSVVVYDLT